MAKIIVLNHKMNLLYNEVEDYIKALNKVNTNDNIIICPSSLYLPIFKEKSKYLIGSQNIYKESKGPYTGEISPTQLKSLNIDYVMIGHSERRIIFNENDNLINEKLKLALKENIKPILCIGENATEKESDMTNIVLNNQINSALVGIQNISNIIVAYEPVWSIGTGNVTNYEDLKATVRYIKEVINKGYQIKSTILYGGSVDENNAKDILNIEEIDGLLIGKTSLDISKLKQILEK